MNHSTLCHKAKRIDINSFKTNKIKFNLIKAKGVPGCEKTTFLLQILKPGDIILHPNKDGALDFLQYSLIIRSKKIQNKFLDSCQTLHPFITSLTKHIKTEKCITYFVHETLMA